MGVYVYIITYREPAIERPRKASTVSIMRSRYNTDGGTRGVRERDAVVQAHGRLNNTRPALEPTHHEGLYCTHRTRQTAAAAGTHTLPARHTHSTAAVGTLRIPSQLQGQGQMPPPVVGWDRTRVVHETG